MAEAILVYEYLLQNGKWLPVKQEARAQFPIARAVDAVAWFKLNKPCPILDPEKKTCRAYQVRPAACSTHFVKSDPDLCSPWSVKSGRYESADMEDLLEGFVKKLMENSAGFGILTLELPIPVALLLAERISVQSGLELDRAVALLYQELG